MCVLFAFLQYLTLYNKIGEKMFTLFIHKFVGQKVSSLQKVSSSQKEKKFQKEKKLQQTILNLNI
jgi:hypothetical protein